MFNIFLSAVYHLNFLENKVYLTMQNLKKKLKIDVSLYWQK